MPNRVRAFCTFGKYHDIEVEDEVTAYLEWPNGATGVFIATTGEAPGTNRLEIAGDLGKLTYENGRITVLQTEAPISQVNATSPNPFAVVPTTSKVIESLGSGPQHVGIIDNFVRAIEQGEPLIAPAEEGIHSVELANAMILSSITGQTVELPLDSQVYAKQLASLVEDSTYQKTNVRELVPDMTGSFGSV
jgi:predicted dehydrogenase